MAKSTPTTRLLRDMARAAKSQRKLVAKLFDIYSGTPAKRAVARKPAKPARPKTTTPTPARLPAPSGRWLEGHHQLPYWLYLPQRTPEHAAQSRWPLVVMLHGCHQSAPDFAQGTRMNRLAQAKGYAVLYPQQSSSAQAQRCWRWFDRAAQEGGGETGVLAALIEHVCTAHRIDRRRIYACGLSAGAGMAAVLALNHPELIAAIGMHSGPVFGACHTPMGALHVMRRGAEAQADAAICDLLDRHATGTPARSLPPMPALLIHGEDDPVVSHVNQQQLARQWLRLNGIPLATASRVSVKPAGRGGASNPHEIHDFTVRRKVMVRVVRIAGLRHEWSGGDPALRFNARARPDASRMMLAFFGAHRR